VWANQASTDGSQAEQAELSEMQVEIAETTLGYWKASSKILPMMNPRSNLTYLPGVPSARGATHSCFATSHRWLASLFLALLLALLPMPARADMNIPPLEEFVQQVSNGDAQALRGIYVPGLFAAVVAQQPEGDRAFVSADENTLTQFGLASRYGSIGLLAHNSVAGKNFFLLEDGQVFYLVYGDGSLKAFHVTRLMHAQALDPQNIRSHFIDLDEGGILSADRLFNEVYDRPGNVILQTCIEANGESSWGRLFVIAEPYARDDPALLFEPEVLDYASILKLSLS
jgi:hypothetical protein